MGIAVSENPFSVGIASASIHLGPRQKPLLTPWCCCHLPSIVYLIPHICPSLGQGHLPEMGNPEQGCLQAGLPGPFRSTLSYPAENIPCSFCKHTCMHATHAKYTVIPPEGNAGVVTVSACTFLSLVYLCWTPKSNNIGEEQPPFQCQSSCVAAVGTTLRKRRISVGARL